MTSVVFLSLCSCPDAYIVYTALSYCLFRVFKQHLCIASPAALLTGIRLALLLVHRGAPRLQVQLGFNHWQLSAEHSKMDLEGSTIPHMDGSDFWQVKFKVSYQRQVSCTAVFHDSSYKFARDLHLLKLDMGDCHLCVHMLNAGLFC